MVLDPELERRIAEILRPLLARWPQLDEEAIRASNRKQAIIPEGASVIDPVGTAPGLVVPASSCVVIVLPGPPRELHTMWLQALDTEPVRAVLERADVYRMSTLRLFGLPESEIAETLREIEADGMNLAPLEITTCLRQAELVIDIRYRPEDGQLSERLRREIVARQGRFVFSEDGESIDDQLAALLAGKRVGLAESSTGGLLAARLTDRPGASRHLAGGVVAYSNEAKVDLLDVSGELIERHGAVSPEVAAAMADGAMTRFRADLGVGITGIAGPGGGSEEKPVGYVCICAKVRGGGEIARDPVLPGDRGEIRDRSTTVAMHLLRRLLRGEEFPL
jgi:nicotinamide-nucleotide amidase